MTLPLCASETIRLPHPETRPDKLRVIFVIPGDGQGSSMIFARRQARSLTREGVGVHLFCLRSRTSLPQLAREGQRFRRVIQSLSPHVIHAQFGTVTALFAACAAPSIPLVITFRGSDLNPVASGTRRLAKLRAAAGRIFSQLAALRAARIVCVSSQLGKRLWWRRDAVVLPTGVDVNEFYPEPRMQARLRMGWPKDDRVILFNASLNPAVKRLDLARQAVALVENALANVRLEVMDGRTPPEQVPVLLNAADGLLVTSDFEGSPTVLQEALACNLPVVSVDVGDSAERLRGVHRCAIVSRDPPAIAAELVRVLDVPSRSNGRSKAPEFSAEIIARHLQRIYLEADRRRRRVAGKPKAGAQKR